MTHHHPRRRRFLRLTTATVATALTVGGCGFDPSSIPVPGTTVSSATYPLHIEFANVLNLPHRAKVIANGVQVGNLTAATVHSPVAGVPGKRGYIVADVTIENTILLPTTTTAELRQDTPLGDVHIALITPPATAGATYASGATIPITQTSQAPQIEDTMAGLAATAGGGIVTNFQDIIRQLNTALPQDPNETARIFGVLGNNLTDVAGNLQTVDSVLDGLELNAQQLLDDKAILNDMLTDYGAQHVADTYNSVVQIILVLTGLGPLSHNALWLTSLVQSLDNAAKAVVPVLFTGSPLDLSTPSNLNKLVDLIQNKLIPFTQMGPKVNVVGATVSDPASLSATDRTDQIIAMLRMIGAVR
ncbi:MlaD family protein [Nocardia sp. NBC_01499]|uniref:MlaD family protein n=1 Tax=Nocardia sp. NBC_01499 TaxID=2903597 RepID=UPI00386648E7